MELSLELRDLKNTPRSVFFNGWVLLGSKSNEEIQTALQSAGYTSGRGTIPGLNGKDANRFALASTMVMTATSMQEIQQMINEAVADRSWLILTFHHILPIGSPASTAYTTTPERLQGITNYLAQNNVPVRTVGAGIALMDGVVTPPVVVPPAPASTTTPPVITPTPTPPAPTPTPAPASGGGGGSSTFVYFGCTQQTALNYNRLANRDQGCLFASTPTPIGTSAVIGASATTSEMEEKNKKDEEDKDKKDKEDKKGEVLGAKIEKMLRHNFKSNLRRGSQGKDVTELQSYLKTNGHFTGPVTGYFGILTQGGVRNFQIKYKIDPIGIVGPKTRAALNNQDEVAFTIASTNANVGLILEKK